MEKYNWDLETYRKSKKLILMHRHFQSTLILMNIETTNCANTLENTLPYDIRIRNVPSESISPHWIVLADCLTTGVNDIWIILSQVWLLSNRKVLLHIQSDDFRKIISKSYNFIKNICVYCTLQSFFVHLDKLIKIKIT